MLENTSMTLDCSSAAERPWLRQKIHAPRGDESILAIPSLSDAPEMARQNHEALIQAGVNIQGRQLCMLRQWARDEACRAARGYVSGWCESVTAIEQPDLIFVGGHQPTLFHPGVWIKNFAVGRLAAQGRAVGLNLVVDNDTLASTTIRVPVGTSSSPRVSTIAFDEPRPAQPWEEARIQNRELFARFGGNVLQATAGWGTEPLIQEFWPAAVCHAKRTDILADCLTAARNQWERQWGVGNLELPISRLCQLDSFLWFASHLFAQLPRFHRIYNDVVHEYRQINRVRSRTHPVPDLREEQEWLEAPFWVWQTGDHRRRRVFARTVGREIWLAEEEGHKVFARLPLTPQGDACCAVKVLRALPEQGIHLRTRALTTTLFARLCLADLFVHGIGGAKYDEMADRIIARFFGLPAPAFLALSATVQLPLPGHSVDSSDAARLRGLLRELEYNADRHLPNPLPPEAPLLVAEKQRLIAEQKRARGGDSAAAQVRAPGSNGYERFKRLRRLNEQLAAFNIPARKEIESELAATQAQLAANAILQDRDYAFCLYPAEKLRHFFEKLRIGEP